MSILINTEVTKLIYSAMLISMHSVHHEIMNSKYVLVRANMNRCKLYKIAAIFLF